MRINQFLSTLFNPSKSVTRLNPNSQAGLRFGNDVSDNIWDTLCIGDKNSNWAGTTYTSKGYPQNSKNTGGVAEYRVKTTQELLDETPEHIKYKGHLTAEQIAEKWATTGEITAQESHYLTIINAKLWGEAKEKSQIPKAAKEIDNALIANDITINGITINPDEEFKISVTPNNQIIVDGDMNPEQREKIQEALQSYNIQLKYTSTSLAAVIKGAYFCNSQNVNNFSEEVRSLTLATMTASKFLYNETGGKLTLDDLAVVGGKIIGLPPELSDLLNGNQLKGVIKNGQNLEGVKICIMQVKAYETKYGKENLPTVTSTFTYKNGKLTLVEDPELTNKAKLYYDGMTAEK
jgi:hypothetical protein